MTEHEAAMEHNWLQSYLIESIDKRLCTSIYCTTCGSLEFRHGLLDAVPRATDHPRPPHLDWKTAYAIAQALARVEPVRIRTGYVDLDYEEAVRLVIFDLSRILLGLDSILGNTWAGNVLESMRSHERYVQSYRDSRIEYESPERVAERREEKRRPRRELHEQRLALKKERDRLWRLAHPETPLPRNPE